MDIFIASKNIHKIDEIKKIFSIFDFSMKDFRDFNLSNEEPIENGKTLVENARIKASFWYEKLKIPIIADDTGLFVPALDGRPGIYSARYAGEHCSYEENVSKLLFELKGKENRKAYFETCSILMYPSGKEIIGIGRLDGYIIRERRGENGFGYDPVFFISDIDKTLAELSDKEKNSISHRYKSLMNLKEKLKKEFYL